MNFFLKMWLMLPAFSVMAGCSSTKYGLIDKTGAIVLAPQYDRIDMPLPPDNYARVVVKGKVGYFDTAKKTIAIAPQFRWGGYFSEDRAWVSVSPEDGEVLVADYRCTIIDRSGQYVRSELQVPCERSGAGLVGIFSGGLAPYRRDARTSVMGDRYDSGISFVNAKGFPVFATTYTESTAFDNGIAVMSRLNSDGQKIIAIMDKSGKEVYPPLITAQASFVHGLAVVRNKNGPADYVDYSGKTVFSGYSGDVFEDYVRTNDAAMWLGVMDRTGKEIVSPKYEWIGDLPLARSVAVTVQSRNDPPMDPFVCAKAGVVAPCSAKGDLKLFHEGLAQYRDKGKWGIMREDGNLLVAPSHQWIGNFSEGFAPVADNYLYGYMDKTGTVTIRKMFPMAGNFSEGFAPVWVSSVPSTCGYIAKTGEIAIPAKYYDCGQFAGGVAIVGVRK
jgi:hypothetical protein